MFYDPSRGALALVRRAMFIDPLRGALAARQESNFDVPSPRFKS
jgi:hypothetical protein